MARGVNGRWVKKYKLFFFIGVIIVFFQLFLAARFLEISKNEIAKDYQPKPGRSVSTTKKPTTVLNKTVLLLDELEFKPDCNITGKNAISAIHRAKSQHCKQLLANVTCRSLAGTLYPEKLFGNCPNDGHEIGKSLGCFKDESNFRLLSGYVGLNNANNSPNYCLRLCIQSGFVYAGVEYSKECFCGNDKPPSTAKLPDSSCNMKCSGDNYTTCGGYYTINIYETGIKAFSPQEANTEVAAKIADPAKIVFLLTLNGRALRQVKRLLRILYRQNHYYYIHVDVRQDYLFRELLPLERRFPNIRLTRKRFATIWGGASLLDMLLSCLRELLEVPLWDWDFIINLSESDYPVKTVDSLEAFLSVNRDRNFVRSHGREAQRFIQKQGIDKTFVECELRMWRVGDRQLPMGIQVDGGSDWITLSRKFVDFVVRNSSDGVLEGLKQVYKYTLLPVESFFHTVLRNTAFCNTYIDNNLHLTNWKRKLGCKCQYKHIVDWCGCSPNDFLPEDWSRIQTTQSKHLYFARKFEAIINQAVVLKLELWLHGLEKPSRAVVNLHSYWQSMYHHLDMAPPPDNGLMTIINSIGRIWLGSLNQSCNLTRRKPVEVTSYHQDDSYKYSLVYFQTGNSTLSGFEVAFKPINLTYLVTPSSVTKRIEELIVSSDYDLKEQVSRNFPRILSPYSDPVLIYKFSSTSSVSITNISCLWIDPIGVLADVTDISLDETLTTGQSKPVLKQPHCPGAWTVKCISKKVLLAEVNFLITPLEFFGGSPLTEQQAKSIHGGFSSRFPVDSFEAFLGNNFNEDVLRRASIANYKKTGKQLQQWIDSLVKKFYVVEKVCGLEVDCNIPSCDKTEWSSFAPDPKSAIGNVNKTTGRFDIW